MRNNRILIFALLALLLANIILVIFLLTNGKKCDKKPYGGRHDIFKLMVKELKLTEQQQKDYKTLQEDHFKGVKPLFDSMRAAKITFFALAREENLTDSMITYYGWRIAEKQSELDRRTFDYFLKIRRLLTAAQQPKFDSLIYKMIQRGKRAGDSAHRFK